VHSHDSLARPKRRKRPKVGIDGLYRIGRLCRSRRAVSFLSAAQSVTTQPTRTDDVALEHAVSVMPPAAVPPIASPPAAPWFAAWMAADDRRRADLMAAAKARLALRRGPTPLHPVRPSWGSQGDHTGARSGDGGVALRAARRPGEDGLQAEPELRPGGRGVAQTAAISDTGLPVPTRNTKCSRSIA